MNMIIINIDPPQNQYSNLTDVLLLSKALNDVLSKAYNHQVCNMANARWPGVKSDDKFNLLWIGIT